jgi:hypothetical protein
MREKVTAEDLDRSPQAVYEMPAPSMHEIKKGTRTFEEKKEVAGLKMRADSPVEMIPAKDKGTEKRLTQIVLSESGISTTLVNVLRSTWSAEMKMKYMAPAITPVTVMP